ncbi:MAG: replication initiation factor domain-containing protein [bacterium]|nr:replication initiation factor domain-containing protein [bacterium]
MARGESALNVDVETGEAISIHSDGKHIKITRHLIADSEANPGIALIDALAFSLIPPDDESYLWVIDQMRSFLDVENIVNRNGCFGFKHSARFGDGAGLIAWGGDSQRGRVYFSIQGKGCSMVEDWHGLADWLESHRAGIKRVDVAHDDFDGANVSILWAVQQYEGGGFNAGGRQPSHGIFGDWLSGEDSTKGRTVGIGNRQSGKYCRIYEKGKEQGDGSSPWVRAEVEWRGKDRVIPYDVLRQPGNYLAGAYPCFEFLSTLQSRIKTVAKGGQIAYEKAVENARMLSGRLVNLMLQVHGGDAFAVAECLRRDGIPARVEPYSYHLIRNPELIEIEPNGSKQG